MKPESEVQQLVQIQAVHDSCILMRNNSGALMDANGRPVRFGLGNDSAKRNEEIKSSDLIGITTIVITQEMVGQTIGVFTAVECKEEAWNCNKKLDKRETAQFNFITWVRSRGGFAGFANKVDDLKEIIRR